MDILKNIINESIEEVYCFNKWSFRNETEFKFELFHILANKKLNGVPLGKPTKNAITPIVHCEARPVNGINSRADIVLCNSTSKYQPQFNYVVDYILELKYKLNKDSLSKEIKKLEFYNHKFKSVYYISAKGFDSSISSINLNDKFQNDIIVKFPNRIINTNRTIPLNKYIDPENIFNIVKKCIISTLFKYGNNKNQFKSYFWCNYEKEISKGFSYPSEGDFNANLYHELRMNLQEGIIIRSEYSIRNNGKSYRIDLVIYDYEQNFLIPIEVKMNWDQFGIKYNKDVSEANLILKRFEILINENPNVKVMPILIVIQDEWRIPTTFKKENSLQDLKNAKIEYDFMAFNEKMDDIISFTHKVK